LVGSDDLSVTGSGWTGITRMLVQAGEKVEGYSRLNEKYGVQTPSGS
jgi:hypothetical protein